MSVSPFDHPFLKDFLGDDEIGALFSAQADMAAMLRFEAALAEAEAKVGVIPVRPPRQSEMAAKISNLI